MAETDTATIEPKADAAEKATDDTAKMASLKETFDAKLAGADSTPEPKAKESIDTSTKGEPVDSGDDGLAGLTEANRKFARSINMSDDDVKALGPNAATVLDKMRKGLDKRIGTVGQKEEELNRRLAEIAAASEQDDDAETDDDSGADEQDVADDDEEPAKPEASGVTFTDEDDYEEGEAGRTGKLNTLAATVTKQAKVIGRLSETLDKLTERLESVDIDDFFSGLDGAAKDAYNEPEAREPLLKLARRLQKAERFSNNRISIVEALEQVMEASPAGRVAELADANRKKKVAQYRKSGLRRPGTQTQDPSPRSASEKRMDNLRKAFAAKGIV